MAWKAHQQDEDRRRKGPWTSEEDRLLTEYVNFHGEGRWSAVAKFSGLNRSGKSCRLRWVNYLRPGLKRGHITAQEEGIIIELHALWGNKWSTIARYLPGRTDNEIKNYWRTHFKTRDNCGSSLSRRDRRKSQTRQKQEQTPRTCELSGVASNQESAWGMIDAAPADSYNHMITDAPNIDDQDHQSMAGVPDDLCVVDEGYLWDGLWNIS